MLVLKLVWHIKKKKQGRELTSCILLTTSLGGECQYTDRAGTRRMTDTDHSMADANS